MISNEKYRTLLVEIVGRIYKHYKNTGGSYLRRRIFIEKNHKVEKP